MSCDYKKKKKYINIQKIFYKKLIQLDPKIKNIVNEIYRTSSKWIWGFEYYSKNYEEIIYRNKKKIALESKFF